MEDLISRQQAIDEGMSYINGDCFCDKEDFAKYIEFIEQLPSAQPKRIKGRWITDKQGYVTCSAICNKCGERTQMLDGYYNFCPHCGLKMEW